MVAYPTEAVYGLGCDPLNEAAFARLLALKQRPEPMLQRLRQTWPGPVTWIVPAAPGVPAWLTGGRDTIAVRVTAHSMAAALCRAFGGALVSTSANRSGEEPARSAEEVRRQFGDRLDDILVGPLGGLERPTRICDARTGATIRE